MAYIIVLLHDLLSRYATKSYYLRINNLKSRDDYFKLITKSYKRFLLKREKDFAELLKQNKFKILQINNINFSVKDFIIQQSKNKRNNYIQHLYYYFSNCIIAKSEHSEVYIVVDVETNKIVYFDVNFLHKKKYYWLTTLMDTNLEKNGIYFYFFMKKIETCISKNIEILRMGPTSDETKIKMGGKEL